MRPISEKMAPVHKSVANYIAKHDQFTIEDVRKGTKKSKASVRAALNRLHRLGRIEPVGSKRLESRGRPRKLYTRTDKHEKGSHGTLEKVG